MVGSIDISFDNKVELDSSSGMTHKEYDVVEKDFENKDDYDEGDYDEDEIEYEDSVEDSVENVENDEVENDENDDVYSLINKLKLVKLKVSIREQEYILMKYEMNMCSLCMKQDMDELCYLDQHMKTMSPVIFETSLFYKKNFDIIESKKKDTLINKFSRVVMYVNLINVIANIVSNCY